MGVPAIGSFDVLQFLFRLGEFRPERLSDCVGRRQLGGQVFGRNLDGIRLVIVILLVPQALIQPAFGMTLRDRQRDYYYAKLDRLFPGMRPRYEQAFGERYSAPARNARHLEEIFAEICQELGMTTKIPVFTPRKRIREEQTQPALF